MPTLTPTTSTAVESATGSATESTAPPREFYTVEQAANYLHLSVSSIRSYIRQGRLQAYRIAGKRKVLINREALLSLLEPAAS